MLWDLPNPPPPVGAELFKGALPDPPPLSFLLGGSVLIWRGGGGQSLHIPPANETYKTSSTGPTDLWG